MPACAFSLIVLTTALAPSQNAGTLYQDFRDAQFDEAQFLNTGANHRKFIKLEREGLRVTLPRAAKPLPQVGITAKSKPNGDVTITASFEILDIETPKAGFGAGVTLQILKDVKQLHIASISHMDHVEGGARMVAVYRSPEMKNRKRVAHKTGIKSGKLRLQRKGDVVHFAYAAMDSDNFTEIMRSDFGPGPIRVRLVANTGNSTVPLDVRFLDFRMEGPKIGNSVVAVSVQNGSDAGSGRWLWLVLAGLGVALILLALGFVWRSKRRSELN